MKRLLAGIICGILLWSLAGCSGENTGSLAEKAGGEAALAEKADSGIKDDQRIDMETALAVQDAPDSYLPPDSANKLTLVHQNRRLALYVDRKTGLIGLLDKAYGKYYYSSPPDTENDMGIDVMYKDTAYSQLVVNAVDDMGNKVQLLSMTDAVLNGGVFVKKVGDSVLCTYTFQDKGIVVPVEFKLGADYLQVIIDPQQMEEKNEFKVYSIKVMPYFGAVRDSEKGYLFIPDGSGAIVEANTSFHGTFYADIFGYEDVLEKDSVKSYQEKILLPVFGIKSDAYGFLAVIDSAYEKCGIGAENAEELLKLNNAYPVFNLRTLTSVSLPSKNFVTKSVLVLEKHADLSVPFIARYYPLKKDSNEYTDMALQYRDYLLQDKKVTPLKPEELYDGYLDLYGYVKKQKSILGWPVVVDQKLTDLSQVEKIITDFTGAKARLGIKYSGWIEGGYFNKIPQKASTAGIVGSNEKLVSAGALAREYNHTLFPSVDLLTAYKNGNGFSAFRHAAKTVNNIAFTQYMYPINLQYKNYELASSRLLSPNFIGLFAEKFMMSYNRLGMGAIAFDEMGSRVYSDYGSNPCSRYEAAGNIAAMIAGEAKNNEVMVTAAAAHLIGIAKHSVAAPYESSNYIISDRSVPFYQIALRGLINISSPAINLESEPGMAVLKCFETGTLPMFSFIGSSTEVLKDSTLNGLYAADYEKWKEYAGTVLDSYEEFNRQIKGRKITQHLMLAEGVFKTAFEGGTSVVVNYNDTRAVVSGREIGPRGYAIVKE